MKDEDDLRMYFDEEINKVLEKMNNSQVMNRSAS
jgi:hypothetical protein